MNTTTRPTELPATSGSALDLGRLIKAVPPDVLEKISLHDIHRIAKNYNGEDDAKDSVGTVFAKPECIFNYCPHPEICGDTCACPSKPNAEVSQPEGEKRR